MSIFQKRITLMLIGLTVLVGVTLATIYTINNVNVKDPSAVAAEDFCKNNGGKWIDSAQECEGLSRSQCESQNGTFNECASVCRNDPDAEICTLQCVEVCEFI